MGEQIAMVFHAHGGRRPGAGRPRGAGRRRYYPGKRPHHSRHTPVHVTLRVTRAVGTLRRRRAYQAVRRALQVTFAREDFRVVHLSIQRTHIHLICEAEHRDALVRGLQGFQISAARRLNAALAADLELTSPRRGPVFLDRYHAEPLTSRRRVRNAIAYVLNNWRRHGDDRRRSQVDPYSTGLFFDGWHGAGPWPAPAGYDPLPVHEPRTWLLTTGWRKHALIDPYEIPGPPRTGAVSP